MLNCQKDNFKQVCLPSKYCLSFTVNLEKSNVNKEKNVSTINILKISFHFGMYAWHVYKHNTNV